MFVAGAEHRTLPRQMWAGVNQELSPTITAAAVVMIVVSVGLMAGLSWLRGGGNQSSQRSTA
jgi:putative spermidine/putrescine transport system permease protein